MQIVVYVYSYNRIWPKTDKWIFAGQLQAKPLQRKIAVVYTFHAKRKPNMPNAYTQSTQTHAIKLWREKKWCSFAVCVIMANISREIDTGWLKYHFSMYFMHSRIYSASIESYEYLTADRIIPYLRFGIDMMSISNSLLYGKASHRSIIVFSSCKFLAMYRAPCSTKVLNWIVCVCVRLVLFA